MKQLVILSGKGGTGKTSVTAAFAHLTSQGPFAGRTLLVDADVDAANLGLILQPQRTARDTFCGAKVAVIDPDTCLMCCDCEAACRFDAIAETETYPQIDRSACEGCAACVYQCPTESIHMEEQTTGELLVSDTRYGPLHHAHLYPGQESSGKLVTEVRLRARQQALNQRRELLIIDGPPGIGCPVIAAVSGADLALIVSEPTIAGLHDLRRALQTVTHFGVPALICINKADIYPAAARDIAVECDSNGVAVVGEIPFDPSVVNAMLAGEAVTAYHPEAPASRALSALWETVAACLAGAPTPLLHARHDTLTTTIDQEIPNEDCRHCRNR